MNIQEIYQNTTEAGRAIIDARRIKVALIYELGPRACHELYRSGEGQAEAEAQDEACNLATD